MPLGNTSQGKIQLNDLWKSLGGFIVIFIAVLLSVLVSGFPSWSFEGPFNIDPSRYPFITCFVISGIVFFINTLLYFELSLKNFLTTSAINGFAYNSTMLNFISIQDRSNTGFFLNHFDELYSYSGLFILQQVNPLINGFTILAAILFVFFLIITSVYLKIKQRQQEYERYSRALRARLENEIEQAQHNYLELARSFERIMSDSIVVQENLIQEVRITTQDLGEALDRLIQEASTDLTTKVEIKASLEEFKERFSSLLSLTEGISSEFSEEKRMHLMRLSDLKASQISLLNQETSNLTAKTIAKSFKLLKDL